MISDEERNARFIAALNELCKEHGVMITLGCGCCGGSEFQSHPADRPAYEIDEYGLHEAD